MTIRDRIVLRESLAALKANPEIVLTDHIINSTDALGHLTRRVKLWYSDHDNKIRVGTHAYCCNANGIGTYEPIQLDLLVTPTRRRGTQTRLNRLQRVSTAGTLDMWTTTQQTGCTVLILDWGGHQYSMVHLQPYAAAEYNALSQQLIQLTPQLGAYFAASCLRDEVTEIVNSSMVANAAPLRYILSQSNSTQLAGGRIQIVGFPNGNRFDFYVQTRDNRGTIDLIIPEWQNWSRFRGYQAVTD